MTRLSVKALRLYDERGLLRPSWVDESSGYRYYAAQQAVRAEAIKSLRALDMPLDDIQQVLDSSSAVSRNALEEHRQRLAERLSEDERRLGFLEELIEGRKQLVPYDISVKTVPETQVVSLTVETTMETIGKSIQEGFGSLMQAVTAGQGIPNAAPFIIYHEVIDEETHGNIEMCIPLASPIPDFGEVVSKVLEGGPAAAVVHKGPYPELGPAYHAISNWIVEHGHQFTGPPRETYLNDPTQVDEADLLTEVAWPIDAA